MASESLARRIGKLRVTIACLIMCLAASFCVAQDPKAVTPEPAKPTDNALIYFYRIKQFAGSALEPSVFCDDKELARMDNGRYFAVDLEPGQHTCRMGDK